MGDYTVVRDALASVVALLRAHITTSGEPGITGVPVDARSPHELETDHVATVVSVWMHRVDVQPDLLNRAAPRPDPDHVLRRPTPLELLLHVTPLDPSAETRALLLGRAVQVLADHRRLAGDDLVGSLRGSASPLLLTLEPSSAYDLSLLWGTVHSPMRAGVGLHVNGVVVDTHVAPQASARVLTSVTAVDQVVRAGAS